jgi:bacterioferritin
MLRQRFGDVISESDHSCANLISPARLVEELVGARLLSRPARAKLSTIMSETKKISREKMVELLNEDLSREYQAVIAYTVYSQTIKGAAYNDIANELATHAVEELQHAIFIAKQIDYLGGSPNTTPKEVKMSDKAEDMLRFDLENERVTLIAYRERIRQADSMGEFALSEVLRKIIAQEQDHLMDLADALGIDPPAVGDQ